MKQRIKKGMFCLAAGFVVLFAGRLAYGYLAPSAPPLNSANALSAAILTTVGGRDSKENYASEKLKVQKGDGVESHSIDQKYEKVASVHSKTGAFEDDEKKVRELTSKYNALIQFEQASGLAGSRRVQVSIGVPPDRFDPMVSELKTVGELSSIRIDKTDKTNEYKELKANRASMEKTRDALIALKSKSGNIEEFTNLENRILEIEREIQSGGVKLGDYDEENAFCTVKLGPGGGGRSKARHLVQSSSNRSARLDDRVVRFAADLIVRRGALDAAHSRVATEAQRDTAACASRSRGRLRVDGAPD
ncbi:MAG: DUF4349 domain-containing protein [Acidobacteriota bacterium]